jgi:hypothetical protein
VEHLTPVSTHLLLAPVYSTFIALFWVVSFCHCNALMCSEFQVFRNSHNVFPLSAFNTSLQSSCLIFRFLNIHSSMYLVVQLFSDVLSYVDVSKSNKYSLKLINICFFFFLSQVDLTKYYTPTNAPIVYYTLV